MLFSNKLFENKRMPLFGSTNNTIQKEDNSDVKDDNNNIFLNNGLNKNNGNFDIFSRSLKNDNAKSCNPFCDSLFGIKEKNDNTNSKDDNHNFTIRKSNNQSQKENIIKCNHKNYFTSYCLLDSKNIGGLMCYECLYKYHKDHISQCIPIRKKLFNYYSNFYRVTINKYKEYLKCMFYEIIKFIDDYFGNDKISDISSLLEEKVNLNFELPIEVPFIERFEIAINSKISSILNKKFEDLFNINKYLNLFKCELKNLSYCENNPNSSERIKIESSVNFKLVGFGIPRIKKVDLANIKFKFYKGNKIIKNGIEYFNEKDFFCILPFASNPIEVESNTEYFIEFEGIGGLSYICDEEEYNDNSKIKITSNNRETFLSCLIIK